MMFILADKFASLFGYIGSLWLRFLAREKRPWTVVDDVEVPFFVVVFCRQ